MPIPIEKVEVAVADGTSMTAYVGRPEKPLGQGVLVLQEAFGVNDYIRRIVARFAERGYLAIAPELFHRTASGFEGSYTDFAGVQEHMQALTDLGITADMTAAFAWLVAEHIPSEKIVAVGFCMGGRASFLANATLPLAAAVSFYGGGIAQTLLHRTGDLHAPQLLLWGGQDGHILSEHRRAVSDALTLAKKPFIEALFSEAGHGFACDAREAYHEPSAKEAWALTDVFLDEHLRSS